MLSFCDAELLLLAVFGDLAVLLWIAPGFAGAVVFAGRGFGYGGGFTYATTARTTYCRLRG